MQMQCEEVTRSIDLESGELWNNLYNAEISLRNLEHILEPRWAFDFSPAKI